MPLQNVAGTLYIICVKWTSMFTFHYKVDAIGTKCTLTAVCYICHILCRILHSSKPPLDIGATYWSLRESVIQCELFLARALQFQFAVDHPHKVN